MKGLSPDSPPTSHTTRGGVPTFLPSWRFVSLSGYSEAPRESLGGNLRVEGRERRKTSVSCPPSTPLLRKGVVCGEGWSQTVKRKGHTTENGSPVRGVKAIMWRARDESVRASHPFTQPYFPHLFSGDLTQAGVCVPSGGIFPSAVSPAVQRSGDEEGQLLPTLPNTRGEVLLPGAVS